MSDLQQELERRKISAIHRGKVQTFASKRLEQLFRDVSMYSMSQGIPAYDSLSAINAAVLEHLCMNFILTCNEAIHNHPIDPFEALQILMAQMHDAYIDADTNCHRDKEKDDA